jgi:hypothetical protein
MDIRVERHVWSRRGVERADRLQEALRVDALQFLGQFLPGIGFFLGGAWDAVLVA